MEHKRRDYLAYKRATTLAQHDEPLLPAVLPGFFVTLQEAYEKLKRRYYWASIAATARTAFQAKYIPLESRDPGHMEIISALLRFHAQAEIDLTRLVKHAATLAAHDFVEMEQAAKAQERGKKKKNKKTKKQALGKEEKAIDWDALAAEIVAEETERHQLIGAWEEKLLAQLNEEKILVPEEQLAEFSAGVALITYSAYLEHLPLPELREINALEPPSKETIILIVNRLTKWYMMERKEPLYCNKFPQFPAYFCAGDDLMFRGNLTEGNPLTAFAVNYDWDSEKLIPYLCQLTGYHKTANTELGFVRSFSSENNKLGRKGLSFREYPTKEGIIFAPWEREANDPTLTKAEKIAAQHSCNIHHCPKWREHTRQRFQLKKMAQAAEQHGKTIQEIGAEAKARDAALAQQFISQLVAEK